MAGRLIKRKEIKQWIISYAASDEVDSEERHIDNLVYRTVNKEQWEGMIWIIYHYVVSCINNLHLDIKAGIFACVKIKGCSPQKHDTGLTIMSFNIKRMPPGIWLFRGSTVDNLFEDVIYSKQISKLYGMKAWLHHWNDDPPTMYYLYLTDD